MFDDGALANPLAEGKLTQALGKTKIERMRDGGDTNGGTRSRWIGTVISAGAFRTGSNRDGGGSSGHNRFLLRKK